LQEITCTEKEQVKHPIDGLKFDFENISQGPLHARTSEVAHVAKNLRRLADALRDHEEGICSDTNRAADLRLLSPIVLETVHEIVNLETMIGALERRLQKLEASSKHS
jgi:hypothetical protein